MNSLTGLFCCCDLIKCPCVDHYDHWRNESLIQCAAFVVNENLANLEHVLNYLPLLFIFQEATVVILVHAWHLAHITILIIHIYGSYNFLSIYKFRHGWKFHEFQSLANLKCILAKKKANLKCKVTNMFFIVGTALMELHQCSSIFSPFYLEKYSILQD